MTPEFVFHNPIPYREDKPPVYEAPKAFGRTRRKSSKREPWKACPYCKRTMRWGSLKHHGVRVHKMTKQAAYAMAFHMKYPFRYPLPPEPT